MRRVKQGPALVEPRSADQPGAPLMGFSGTGAASENADGHRSIDPLDPQQLHQWADDGGPHPE